MPVTLSCEFCSEEYEVIPSRAEESRFCSNDCKSKYQSDNFDGKSNPCWRGGHEIEVSCSVCGDKVVRRKDKLGNVAFCSKNCESEWKSNNWTGGDSPAWDGGKVKLECENCDDSYKVVPSVTEKSRFCSYDCLYEHRSKKGSNNINYKGSWQKVAKEVRERDGECQYCGMSRQNHKKEYGCDLHVHHIVRYKDFEHPENANKKSNLVSLCAKHHIEAERNDIEISNTQPD